MDKISFIHSAHSYGQRSIEQVLKLTSEGSSIPFISRYRKEATGNLDEIAISNIIASAELFDQLLDRKATILKAISEQGVLTQDLQNTIQTCFDPTKLEDLYLPYKKRKKTLGDKARERGLEPLAKIIMAQRTRNIRGEASRYVGGEVVDTDDAIQGACHIVSEWVNEQTGTREFLRNQFLRFGVLNSKLVKSKKEEAAVYEDYFDFSESLHKCPSHRFLAMMRGQEEGFLRLNVECRQEELTDKVARRLIKQDSETADLIQAAVKDGLQRLTFPSIENEVISHYKALADKQAIEVFSSNLKQLLLTAPLGSKRVLAIDPGFRTGCKVAVLSETGQFKQFETIYPHPPQNQTESSENLLFRLIQKHGIEAIAIGNGTASRETRNLVDGLVAKSRLAVEVYVVSESGASIYSASATAREEFPDLDVTVRGAISIGRRLMDPLAELVKIDPKSIGVGQYQHDVDQSLLKKSLTQTVESAVNQVGIDLNTASPHLLQFVSGLGPTLAQNIILHRQKIGAYTDRKQLLDVPRLGGKAYEQCAGFLRVRNGNNELDNTGVHPETYGLVEKMAKSLNLTSKQLMGNDQIIKNLKAETFINDQFGKATIEDIFKELKKPGHDPRGKAKAFAFDPNLKTIQDLIPGMVVPGIVGNITQFGAFVDIGIKENGLLHISEMKDGYISDPNEVVNLGQQLEVRIVAVDLTRGRINLSLKNVR